MDRWTQEIGKKFMKSVSMKITYPMHTVGCILDCNKIKCEHPKYCLKCFTEKICDRSPLNFDLAHIVAEYCEATKSEFVRNAQWQWTYHPN